jgi:DNA-3-methyladenine glycosylase
VLVRALEPVEGVELMRRRRPRVRRDRDLTNGPGKLCLALGVDGSMNRQSLQRGPLVVRDYVSYPDSEIAVTPRIGIRQAADWPLRWIVSGSEFVSKR